MRNYATLLLICLLIYTAGCEAEKTFIFSKNYDEVYSKTIQYVIKKGWAVDYQDKDAKTIRAVLHTEAPVAVASSNYYGNNSSTIITSSHQDRDTISFLFKVTSDGTSVTVMASSDDNSMFWNKDATIQEYYNFITTEAKG